MQHEPDRIRRRTADEVLRRIDDDTVASLISCAESPPGAERRLAELEREWDTDRVLEAEAATIGLVGLALGTLVRRPWLALTGVVAGSVLCQAATGRHPLLPLFRRLGLRSAKEIARERYALKALRGDFTGLNAEQAAAAVLNGAAPADRPAAADRPATGTPPPGPAGAAARLPATTQRVQQHTAPEVNDAIRRRTEAEIVRLEGASAAQIEQRLQTLEREWDVERLLQTNASALVLLGLTLGTTVSRKFLLLPAAVLGFFGQHAVQGWCPPIPVLRRLGFRTQAEIERERHALKALRGDFDTVPARDHATAGRRVRAALAAVDR